MWFKQDSQARASSRQTEYSGPSTLVQSALFLYCWQQAGVFHLFGHYTAATILSVPATVTIPPQRFVPVWGSMYTLAQPHEAMYVKYDSNALERMLPWQRVTIGFLGPYTQVAYMILVGLMFPKVMALLGGYKNYVICILTWQLLYFWGYAIFFWSDCNSDFVLFAAKSFDCGCPPRDPSVSNTTPVLNQEL
ncbi:hypothetical protein CYMTET_12744 [Cymbomonas tetramitiformis]|uniref:Uncharacterized protein n=1 Tax=Cymbomonas tetramitiformis TaxID=36881 RepID=A0AAE0LC48_9CHLO|nr:hypothetical protein CYMTET_12744 [Cymbomonas tetramitiformis]